MICSFVLPVEMGLILNTIWALEYQASAPSQKQKIKQTNKQINKLSQQHDLLCIMCVVMQLAGFCH